MFIQFITVGSLLLLSAMLPGPDFAIVTKNAIFHGRRAGLFTALGIALACMVHVTYCILGVAIILSQSVLFFNLVKYIGASYLIYLGITSLRAKPANITQHQTTVTSKRAMPAAKALRQGIICNLFNPKATLFFLALFTTIIKPGTPISVQAMLAVEIFLIVLAWFSTLTFLLSHPKVMRSLNKVENYIEKTLGVFFIAAGIGLAFLPHH